MNTTDYDSNDECVCGSDAAALKYCKVHVQLVPLSKLIEHFDFEEENEEVKQESEKVGQNKQ